MILLVVAYKSLTSVLKVLFHDASSLMIIYNFLLWEMHEGRLYPLPPLCPLPPNTIISLFSLCDKSVTSDLTLHILFRRTVLWGPPLGSWWSQWIPSSLHLPFPIYPLTSVSSSFPFVLSTLIAVTIGYWLQFSWSLYKLIAKVNASEWRLCDRKSRNVGCGDAGCAMSILPPRL